MGLGGRFSGGFCVTVGPLVAPVEFFNIHFWCFMLKMDKLLIPRAATPRAPARIHPGLQLDATPLVGWITNVTYQNYFTVFSNQRGTFTLSCNAL